MKIRQMGLIALSESGRALPRFETQRRYSGPQVVVAFLAAPRKSRLNSFVTDGIARNEQTAIGIIHQIGALGTGPPAVKRTLSAVAYDDQIGSNLLSKLSDLFGWLASHQLSYGVKSQVFQPGDAFIEYFFEALFHLNGCPSESYLGQQQCAAIGENG